MSLRFCEAITASVPFTFRLLIIFTFPEKVVTSLITGTAVHVRIHVCFKLIVYGVLKLKWRLMHPPSLIFISLSSENMASSMCSWHFSYLKINQQLVWNSDLGLGEDQRYSNRDFSLGGNWSQRSLSRNVPPESLKNGQSQSTSEELLPSCCTVKLILIKIDSSIWDTWVINF